MKCTMLTRICVLVMLVLSVAGSSLAAAAQDASPDSGESLLAGLGLPVLEVTLTADGIQAPAEIAAGPVLLTVTNTTDGFAFVDLVQLPEGVSVTEYAEASSSEGALPEWASEVVVFGGTAAPPAVAASIALNLALGEVTIVAAGDAGIAEPSAMLTVTGEADPAAADAVAADLAVDLGHYTFDFPDTLAAGPQVWRVTNSHDGVLHHVIVAKTDRLYTVEEVQEGITGDFSGTPVADGFSLFVLPEEDAAASPVISGGQTVWIETNLEPGYYVAICFLPDPGGDMPHLFAGMIDTFEVPGS